MRRREFVRSSALGSASLAGASVVMSGCAPAILGRGPSGPPLDAVATRELVERIDAGLTWVARAPIVSMHVGDGVLASRPRVSAYAAEADRLGQAALRTMLVASAIQEVPAGELVPEPVSERIVQHQAEMDRTMVAHAGLLAGMPESERRRMGRYLRAQPEVGLDFVRELELRAEEMGIGPRAREKLRNGGRDLVYRMSRQGASGVIDDVLDRVHRVALHGGVDTQVLHAVITQAATTAIWQQVAEGEHGGSGVGGGLDVVPMPPTPEERARRGVHPMRTGGVLTGLGAVLLGISIAGAVVSTDGLVWAAGITIGAVHLLIGLITLIVGAVMYASDDGA